MRICTTITVFTLLSCRGGGADLDAGECPDEQAWCTTGEVTESGEEIGECADLRWSCYHCGQCRHECRECGPGFHPAESDPQMCFEGICTSH